MGIVPSDARADESTNEIDAYLQPLKQESDRALGELQESWDREEKAWREEQERYYQKWKDSIVSSRKEFVDYTRGDLSRARVDYEEGKIRFEVLVPESSEGTGPELRSQLKAMSDRLLERAGSRPAPLQKEEVAGDWNVDSWMQRVQSLGEVVGTDGVRRKRLQVTLDLVPNLIRERAERIMPTVKRWASEFGVDPALVLGVIRQESYFNHLARSQADAYGLMQIVPKHAGREVMTLLKGEAHTPSADFLYQPENNVMVGTKYLERLLGFYFKDVQDPVKRTYLTICAYNWGPGRIRKAIDSGRLDLSASTDQVYRRLLEVAPDETRNYLRRVTQFRDEFLAPGQGGAKLGRSL